MQPIVTPAPFPKLWPGHCLETLLRNGCNQQSTWFTDLASYQLAAAAASDVYERAAARKGLSSSIAGSNDALPHELPAPRPVPRLHCFSHWVYTRIYACVNELSHVRI